MKRIWLILIILYVIAYSDVLIAQRAGGENHWLHQTDADIDKVIVGDFNGDRKADIAYHINNSLNKWMIKTTPEDTGVACYGQGINKNIWVGDFNGDGLDDKMTLVDDNGPRDRQGLWIALATKDLWGTTHFGEEKQWSHEVPPDMNGCIVGDFNGDGMADLAYHCMESNIHTWKVLYSARTYFKSPVIVGRNQGVNNAVWAADVNGDGVADKISHVNSTDNTFGGWWVSVTIPDNADYTFPGEGVAPWLHQTDPNIDKCIVGDFNGDGKADIVYHLASTDNIWKVAYSDGTKFLTPVQLSSGQGVNQGVWAADFSGEGICDKVTFVNSTSPPWGGWWISTTNDDAPVKVGIWYRPVETNWWGTGLTDNDQNPIVGWGTDIGYGPYSTQNPIALNRQIDAMLKCDFDFIISDNTNGVAWPLELYQGDGAAYNGLVKLFDEMSRRKNTNQHYIPIAVSLGYEFWDKYEIAEHHAIMNWYGWNRQYERIDIAMASLSGFVNSGVYFFYREKPLIIPWLNLAAGYPPEDTCMKVLPKWTVRYALGDAATFCVRNSPLTLNGNTQPHFFEGMDSKRYWGFGAGPHDIYSQFGFSWEKKLPIDREQMAIMPGNRFTTLSPVTERVPRRLNGKEFYAQSWRQVLENRPKIVTIAEWNDWTEGRAIEGCEGNNGWVDLNNVLTYDYYMQMTKSYVYIFKNQSLPPNDSIFVRQYNDPLVYSYFNGNLVNLPSDYKPFKHPIIELPENWLQSHNYIQSSGLDNFIASDICAYPNPFNPSVKLNFNVSSPGRMRIQIYNILGQLVANLADCEYTTGRHSITWVADKYCSGVYIVRYEHNGKFKSQKIVLQK